MPILADDTGIEIDALGGEPGIHARRWKDGKTRMSDQEVIKYCLVRMKGIPWEKRTAQFRTVIAIGIPISKGQALRTQGLALPNEEIELFDGVLRGLILEKPAPLRIEGFPFESLFYIPKWKMVLGEAHQLPVERKRRYLTHRERAVEKALLRIQSLL
jgi:XTP/dITP diphosphohydrolase